MFQCVICEDCRFSRFVLSNVTTDSRSGFHADHLGIEERVLNEATVEISCRACTARLPFLARYAAVTGDEYKRQRAELASAGDTQQKAVNSHEEEKVRFTSAICTRRAFAICRASQASSAMRQQTRRQTRLPLASAPRT